MKRRKNLENNIHGTASDKALNELSNKSGNAETPDEGNGEIAEPLPEGPQDEEIIIRISRDRMKASVMLLPPDGGRMLTYEDIMQKLKEKGISYGIDEKAIHELLNNRPYERTIVVAEGRAPQNGKDAVITYHIDPNKTGKPKINSDGTVDYHWLNNIENVSRGQILATLTPPTNGIPGMTVTGDPVPSRPGRPLPLPKGKNTRISEDGLKLLSAIDGKAEVINQRIHVYSVHEVTGNVDNSTGNIDFIGNVIIHGNVLSGFEVRAGGSIEVRGVVEGATLIAQKDVLLRKGFQGMRKGIIKAEGSVAARFIENGTVFAKGDVIVETIMHSDVVSGGYIKLVDDKALIVGGKVHAILGISALTIGSPMATRTLLEVGISPEVRDEYNLLKEKLMQMERDLTKVEQILAMLGRMESSSQLSVHKQLIKQRAIKTKIKYGVKIPEIRNRLNELEEMLSEVAKGKIHVRKTVYPGVSITIGPSSLHIKDAVQYVTFKRDEGEIVQVPYEG